jgi:Glycosyl transferase family 2
MKYSIIVLIEQSHPDSIQFIQNLHDIFDKRQETFEIIVLLNGVNGLLATELEGLPFHIDRLKAFEFNTKTTQAVCLRSGVRESIGDIIVVCDSYQQITNHSFTQLLDHLDEGTDVISPWRQHRVDTRFNQFQSKVFNATVRFFTDSKFHDLSCTVKIFRREILEETEIYGNMYRFLPILAGRRGFSVKEVICEHHQQRGMSTFYSLPHYFTVFVDILTLYFNVRFTRKPLRFFSAVGFIFLLMGLLITSYIFIQKFFWGYPIGGRPLLLLAIIFMVLGVQASSVGLLGEIIAFTYGRHRKEYTVEKIV